MEQTHCRLFMLKGTGFNDRADKHLRKTAAHRIYNCADDYSHKRVGHYLRKKRKSQKSCCRKQLRTHNASAVAYSVRKLCTENIHNKLGDKENG